MPRTLHRKCFNHVHVQKRGFTKFSVFLKRASLLNPRVRERILWLFLWKEPGKSLEVRFDFGPRPGFSEQLFGSRRGGTELERMTLNSSYHTEIAQRKLLLRKCSCIFTRKLILSLLHVYLCKNNLSFWLEVRMKSHVTLLIYSGLLFENQFPGGNSLFLFSVKSGANRSMHESGARLSGHDLRGEGGAFLASSEKSIF